MILQVGITGAGLVKLIIPSWLLASAVLAGGLEGALHQVIHAYVSTDISVLLNSHCNKKVQAGGCGAGSRGSASDAAPIADVTIGKRKRKRGCRAGKHVKERRLDGTSSWRHAVHDVQTTPDSVDQEASVIDAITIPPISRITVGHRLCQRLVTSCRAAHKIGGNHTGIGSQEESDHGSSDSGRKKLKRSQDSSEGARGSYFFSR